MFVFRVARRLALHGFVLNREDGSVYVEASGSMKELAELEESLRMGPQASRVEKVVIALIPGSSTDASFEVRY